MLDADAWAGVNALIDNYAEVRNNDIIVIAFTPDSQEFAAWVFVCLEERGFSPRRVPMLPLRDEGFPTRLAEALPSPKELPARLIILTLERDTMSHDDAIRAALSKYDNSRCVVIRAISSSKTLFSHALQISPRELSARNTTILVRCMKAKQLHIKAPGGTELDVTLDNHRYRWVSNRGIWRQGSFVILPAGEVATFPASIEGVLVADFAFNANVVTDRDARLHKNPVTICVRDGKATSYECKDPDIMRFLEECFKVDCVANVGEIGFGTNNGIADAIPMNSHINERRPGVHLGFGDHNQMSRVVGYNCALHIDLIAAGGLIWSDDDSIPLDLDHISPSSEPHPITYHAEDLISSTGENPDIDVDDCCGVLTRGGIQLFSS